MSGTNENPGWAFGYVPSPAEWNAEFASKVDGYGGSATGLTAAGVIAQGMWTLTGATFVGGTFNGTTLQNVSLSGTLTGGALFGATLEGDTANTGIIVGGTISGAVFSGGTAAPSVLVVGSGTVATIVGLDGSAHPQGLVVSTGLAVISGNHLIATATPPLTFKGLWNATTNSPSLSSAGGGGAAGDFYQINPGGSTTIDGISVWAVGALIENVGGTVWIENNLTSSFGTMAYQNSNSVDVTGGVVENLSTLSATVATLGDFAVTTGAPYTGFQLTLTDSTNGKVILGYDFNDTWAVNAFKIGGQQVPTPVAMPGVPSYGSDVTFQGGVGDGRRGWFYATWTKGGATLTISQYNGALTSTVGSPTISVAGVVGAGIAFQSGVDDGAPIYLQGAGTSGADLTTSILEVGNGATATLATPILTAPSGSINAIWPCFQQSDVGKVIWISGAEVRNYFVDIQVAGTTTQVGAVSGGNTIVVASAGSIAVADVIIDETTPTAMGRLTMVETITGNTLTLSASVTSANGDTLGFGAGPVQVEDTAQTYGFQAVMGYIATVNSAYEVTLGFTTGITGFSTASTAGLARIAWFSDNGQAIGSAADVSQQLDGKIIYFPGTNAVFGSASMQSASPQYRPWFGANTNRAAILTQRWLGDNWRGGEHFDVAGNRIWQKQVPLTAGGFPGIPRTANLRKQAPNMAGQTAAAITIAGASSALTDSPDQNAATFEVDMFFEKFLSDNTGVSVTKNNRGVGGTNIAQWDNGGVVSNSTAYWWATNPSETMLNYVLGLAANFVYMVIGGQNDGFGFHPVHFWSLVNRIRTGLPTTNLMWQTMLCKGSQSFNGDSNSPEVNAYCSGYIRGACWQAGIPLVDMEPHSERATFGWDQYRRRERIIPAYTAAVSSTVPWSVSDVARDMSVILGLSGASGSAAWSALGKLSWVLSKRQDNLLILDIDASGFLRYAVQDWGAAVSTPCALALNGTTLTTSGQTSFSSLLEWPRTRFYIKAGDPNLGPFTSGNAGQCVMFPTADGNNLNQRTFITTIASGVVAWVLDCPGQNQDVILNGTLVYGGMMFVPADATAQSDITITDTSGNVLHTKITGYTNQNTVTLRDPWPHAALTSGTPATVWVGRWSIPPTSSAVLAGTDAGANPQLALSVKGRRLIVTYTLGGLTYVEPPIVLDTIIPRHSGFYQPLVWATGTGTLAGTQIFVDEDDFSIPGGTEFELRGDDSDGLGLYGGGDGPASPSAEVILRPVLEAQDLAF